MRNYERELAKEVIKTEELNKALLMLKEASLAPSGYRRQPNIRTRI
jgi:hypothetical protein